MTQACQLCPGTAVGACCSSHNKQLCHHCYRKTHFVEVCVQDCRECAAEGLPLALVRESCPTCDGSGTCTICHSGSIPEPGLDCQCEATHKCVDCYGLGTHRAYAAEQMRRIRAVLQRSGLLGGAGSGDGQQV